MYPNISLIKIYCRLSRASSCDQWYNCYRASSPCSGTGQQRRARSSNDKSSREVDLPRSYDMAVATVEHTSRFRTSVVMNCSSDWTSESGSSLEQVQLVAGCGARAPVLCGLSLERGPFLREGSAM